MEEIKIKMQQILTKWAGKPESSDTYLEKIDRKIDRAKYRQLKRDLENPTDGDNAKQAGLI